MKKSWFVTGTIFLAGILAYFGGYYYYTSTNLQAKVLDPVSVQRAVLETEEKHIEKTEHYFAKIENEMLIIYEMPEELIYESIKLSGLQLTENEYIALLDGIHFQNLSEIFNFLENSMS